MISSAKKKKSTGLQEIDRKCHCAFTQGNMMSNTLQSTVYENLGIIFPKFLITQISETQGPITDVCLVPLNSALTEPVIFL